MTENLGSVPNERDLLLATIDLPTVEREAYLDQACQGNAALKARIELLLENAAATGSFMAAPAVDLQATTPMDALDVGCQIDRYRLMEQLGEGGMGVVFVAEQTEPVRRKVALKVIKPGMDSKAVIARFEAERQALALMDHPNIARVLDGGTTRERLPYFVMELVRGLPITQYCDQAKATIDQRLQLFIDVCNAVQHAHQKGIIHRDLKPSNIMVTLHDGKPVVKVIDFGVAKALHQQLTQHTVYTAINQVVGTPLYMSPEQLELSGLDIDTRTDIYSLGVLLYELLSGTTPFDRDRLLKSGFDEMRRIIREEDPPRPSYRVTTMPLAQLSTVSEKRGLDQRTLSRSIESELDWIVMKSLEKDRNRRYASTTEFAQDIQRFRDNDTVQACPPSLGYKLRKTVRKHRVALATATLVWLSLLIGLIATTWQWQRAREAEADIEVANRLANQRADLANHRLGIAENAIEVMYSEFAKEWLGSQSGTSKRQREFLIKAVASFQQLAELSPEDQVPRSGAIRANLRSGQLQKALGQAELALKSLTTAYELAVSASSSLPENVEYQLLSIEACISIAEIHMDRGEHDQKIAFTDKAASILPPLLAYKDLSNIQKTQISKSLSSCGGLFATEKTRTDEAARLVDDGLKLARELLMAAPDDIDAMNRVAGSLSAKGLQAMWSSDRLVAKEAYAESLAIRKKIIELAPDAIEVLLTLPGIMSQLGFMLSQPEFMNLPSGKAAHEKNTADRLQLLRELVPRFPDRPELVSNLALALRVAGRTAFKNQQHEEAWANWNESIFLLETIVKKFPDLRESRKVLVTSLRTYAEEKQKLEDLDQAKRLLEKCNSYLVDFTHKFPTDFEMYLIQRHTLRDLATIDLLEGNTANAIDRARQIMSSRQLELSHREYTESALKNYDSHFSNIVPCLTAQTIANHCLQILESNHASESEVAACLEFKSEIDLQLMDHLTKWRAQNSDLNLEWQQLADRIDLKDSWRWFHNKPSIETILEDSLVSTEVILIEDLLAFAIDSKRMPANCNDIALASLSAPEFSPVIAKIRVLLQRGRAEFGQDSNYRRANMWLLYRLGQYESCKAELEMLGALPDDAFLHSMVEEKIGNHSEALGLLEKGRKFLSDNESALIEVRKQEPFHGQPNIETYRRLQAEAARLILPDSKDSN